MNKDEEICKIEEKILNFKKQIDELEENQKKLIKEYLISEKASKKTIAGSDLKVVLEVSYSPESTKTEVDKKLLTAFVQNNPKIKEELLKHEECYEWKVTKKAMANVATLIGESSPEYGGLLTVKTIPEKIDKKSVQL